MNPVSENFLIRMAIREAELQLGDFYDEYVCNQARRFLGWPADDEHENAISRIYSGMLPAGPRTRDRRT